MERFGPINVTPSHHFGGTEENYEHHF